jgi:superfamily II RNA helicase
MANRNVSRRRTAGRPYAKQRVGTFKPRLYANPRLDPQLRNAIKKIGIPKPVPFKPDPFQRQALDAVAEGDVLVSAPTGAGKTWIASQAISAVLSQGRKSWYASPLKALSNSIYLQFRREFGAANCGILTGDRKENPTAPIIVGTTEILRNQLYDAMQAGTTIGTDLVILDEAHYLSDPDRGVVWEEVLIYLPVRVRLLLLSATISNAEEIASWLKEVRGEKTRVIRATERPVPLETLFLFPDGLLSPLGGRKGLTSRVKKFVTSRSARAGRGFRSPAFGEIIKILREFDLLPAIFFLKSRADCDKALRSCSRMAQARKSREEMKELLAPFLTAYPYLEHHRQLDSLLESRVGSHHAGQLPFWKVLIEKFMNRGYLEAIFSTSTVAAGVNFPARTVVLIQSDRFNGHEFANLTATDLHQMTGRAGRRGKDNIGFALVVPGLHQDPQLIHELKDSPPEPLVSQIRINFSMTLNLLLSHRPIEVKDLLDRSFASFQNMRSRSDLQVRWDRMLEALKKAIPKGKCDPGDPYAVVENIQKRAWREQKARRRADAIWRTKRADIYREVLEPGRLFQHKDKGIYVVFDTHLDRDQPACTAHKIGRTLRTKKGRIHLRNVPLDRIRRVFDSRLTLPADASLARLQELFDAVEVENLKAVEITIPEEETRTVSSGRSAETTATLNCVGCAHLEACHLSKKKGVKRALEEFQRLEPQIEGIRGGLWLSFKRHMRFLRETDFVTADDQLTADGYWASKLRVDQPLLIAEAIRKGAFQGRSPEILAGSIAPFVWDRIQEVELAGESPTGLGDMEAAFDGILGAIGDIRRLKTIRGFESPPIQFWPAAALFLWAKGIGWETLLSFAPADEGDMASLIVRTIDHLRQVRNLMESHPGLAATAATAIDLLSREPVVVDES